MSGIVCKDHHADNMPQRRFLLHATKHTRYTYYYDSASLHLQKALFLKRVSIVKEERAMLLSQAENGLHDLTIPPCSVALYVRLKRCLLDTHMHSRVGMHRSEQLSQRQVLLHGQGQFAQQFSRV